MTFARRLFLVAAIYGIAVLFPMYFLEARIGAEFPPPITHPESYYGFVGVALAWQVMYLLVAREPARFRPVMLVGAGAKTSFVVATAVLWALGRAEGRIAGAVVPDLVLAALFVEAWRRTPEP